MSYFIYYYAECHNAECRYAKYRHAECQISFTIMLSVIMLNVIMLSVVILNVVMLSVDIINVVMLIVVLLNVIMLSVVAPYFQPSLIFIGKKAWVLPLEWSPISGSTQVGSNLNTNIRLGWGEVLIGLLGTYSQKFILCKIQIGPISYSVPDKPFQPRVM
jgi:hypothetical protein